MYVVCICLYIYTYIYIYIYIYGICMISSVSGLLWSYICESTFFFLCICELPCFVIYFLLYIYMCFVYMWFYISPYSLFISHPYIYIYIYIYGSPSLCLSVCLSVCLSLSACLSFCLFKGFYISLYIFIYPLKGPYILKMLHRNFAPKFCTPGRRGGGAV